MKCEDLQCSRKAEWHCPQAHISVRTSETSETATSTNVLLCTYHANNGFYIKRDGRYWNPYLIWQGELSEAHNYLCVSAGVVSIRAEKDAV